MSKGKPRVHTSVEFDAEQHRALMTRLFKERRSLSQWARDAAEAYLADGKVKRAD